MTGVLLSRASRKSSSGIAPASVGNGSGMTAALPSLT